MMLTEMTTKVALFLCKIIVFCKREDKTLLAAVLFKHSQYLHLSPLVTFFACFGTMPSRWSSLFCQYERDLETFGTQAPFLLCALGNIFLYSTTELKTCRRCKSIITRSILLENLYVSLLDDCVSLSDENSQAPLGPPSPRSYLRTRLSISLHLTGFGRLCAKNFWN